jgi:hypothetical protein
MMQIHICAHDLGVTDSCVEMSEQLPDITIRLAREDDDGALQRLAALDSSTVPDAPLLLAEIGGELHAAVSVPDGSAIADPFKRTADLVELLHARIASRRAALVPARRSRLVPRLRPRHGAL